MICLRPAVEDNLNDHWQKARERKAEQGCKESQEDECRETFALAYEAYPLSHALQNGFFRFLRNEPYLNHHEGCDDCKVGYPIHCEAPGCPESGIGSATKCRSQDSGEVELDRVHRDRIGQVFRGDQRWQQG